MKPRSVGTTMRRVLSVFSLSAILVLLTDGTALAQVEPEPPPPTEVDCNPLSIACGLQVGPNNFDIDILPGGSVFPPQPPSSSS